MARTVGIGHQDFGRLIQSNLFYIDKTEFIKEWWENGDAVTLISRPRRFGKTLNMSMLEQFFSLEYANHDRNHADQQGVSALGFEQSGGGEAILEAKGIPAEWIRKYGFAFCGKEVLIG